MKKPIQRNNARKPPTNKLAIISLVSGPLSWVIMLSSDHRMDIFFYGLLIFIWAIGSGHIARSQIKQSKGAEGGEGLVEVALILYYLLIAGVIALFCLGIVLNALKEGSLWDLLPS